jgi:hypothetical protein
MKAGSRGDPLDFKKEWHFIPDPGLAARLLAGESIRTFFIYYFLYLAGKLLMEKD